VDRVLVVKASPLIFLARIDRLDLLVSLAKLLVVPEAVIREIQAVPIADGIADQLKALPSISWVDDRRTGLDLCQVRPSGRRPNWVAVRTRQAAGSFLGQTHERSSAIMDYEPARL